MLTPAIIPLLHALSAASPITLTARDLTQPAEGDTGIVYLADCSVFPDGQGFTQNSEIIVSFPRVDGWMGGGWVE